jgi:hypothetical protein
MRHFLLREAYIFQPTGRVAVENDHCSQRTLLHYKMPTNLDFSQRGECLGKRGLILSSSISSLLIIWIGFLFLVHHAYTKGFESPESAWLGINYWHLLGGIPDGQAEK